MLSKATAFDAHDVCISVGVIVGVKLIIDRFPNYYFTGIDIHCRVMAKIVA